MTRDKTPKQTIESLQQVLGAVSYFFKLITIFNNCIIANSYKMDRMTIADRARAVEILVSASSLRQQLLTLSQCQCLSCLQYFKISFRSRNFLFKRKSFKPYFFVNSVIQRIFIKESFSRKTADS